MVQVLEYETNPEHYADGATVEEMLKVDLMAANDDPAMFFDMEGVTTDIRGEIIPQPRCRNCGMEGSIEEIKAKHPGAVSCCPERDTRSAAE